jgi:conjugal transfer/entry exclusion protein
MGKSEKLAKVRQAFEAASDQFVKGKISESDFRKALKKMEEVTAKVYGENLDFVDVEKYLDERRASFSKYITDSVVDKMTSTTWKSSKKEAGIKSSGFLKKADAGVGGKLDKYSKAHASWKASCVKTAGGDTQLLLKANSAAVDLKKALQAFVAAKEFKSDLAKELQTKCNQFVDDLDKEMQNLSVLIDKAGDSSFMKGQINSFVPGLFKD